MTPWVVPIVVALLAPLFAYLGIARRLSGRIATSEATQLWEESTALRNEYKHRLDACEIEIKRLRNELQACTARNTVLRRENSNFRRKDDRD